MTSIHELDKPYIYAVIDKEMRWWTGCGWTDKRASAKKFRSAADAEPVLRRMMLDNVKAKVGTERGLR